MKQDSKIKIFVLSLFFSFFILKSASLFAVPASQIKVTGIPNKSGEVKVVVVNEGDSVVSLKTEIKVEQKKSDIFETVKDVHQLLLRSSCRAKVDSCVVLKPKETLKTASWKMMGDAQCDCEECWHIPAGGYRFVLTSCDGKEVFKSSPFRVEKSK